MFSKFIIAVMKTSQKVREAIVDGFLTSSLRDFQNRRAVRVVQSSLSVNTS